MRVLVLVVLIVMPIGAVRGQQQAQSNPAKPCGDESVGLPDFYYQAVLSQIEVEPPPNDATLISIAVGAEIKLVLWTDGEKYQLWTDEPEVPQGIGAFLHHLDDICQLPPDPRDAAAMIKIRWEHKDLSAAQFARIHQDFTKALSRYVQKIQDRYRPLIATQELVVHFETLRHPIVYDNGGYEHVEVHAWDVTENDRVDPLIAWVRELQKLGVDSFHRQFWTDK